MTDYVDFQGLRISGPDMVKFKELMKKYGFTEMEALYWAISFLVHLENQNILYPILNDGKVQTFKILPSPIETNV